MIVPDETQAYAEIVGEYPNQRLNLHLPRGDRGEKGDKGDKGDMGDIGLSTTLSVLETTTGVDYQYPGPVGPKGDKGDPGGIVIGTDLATTNLNDITTAGTYRQSTGANASLLNNYPAATTIGTLVVYQRHSTAGVQIYTPAGQIATRFYVRGWEGSTWYPWKVYSSNRVDQTAGRAIYQWDDLNNREQLIYGDTGYRNITALFSDVASGAVYLRRMGNLCSMQFSGTEFTNTSSTLVHNYTGLIPSGFRSSYASRIPLSPSAGQITNFGTNGNLDLTKGIATTMFNEIMWNTSDPWPTVLPGTAAGTIPNV